MDQIRGLEGDIAQSSRRQVLRRLRRRSMAGSTTGASTRTTITCGCGLVAPAVAASGCAASTARAQSSACSLRPRVSGVPVMKNSDAMQRRPSSPTGLLSRRVSAAATVPRSSQSQFILLLIPQTFIKVVVVQQNNNLFLT